MSNVSGDRPYGVEMSVALSSSRIAICGLLLAVLPASCSEPGGVDGASVLLGCVTAAADASTDAQTLLAVVDLRADGSGPRGVDSVGRHGSGSVIVYMSDGATDADRDHVVELLTSVKGVTVARESDGCPS